MVAAIAATTAAIYGLRELVPVVSTGVLYLLAVLLVSTYWGAGLGLLTALLSAAAFNFFHIPPTGRFTIAEGENWVALAVYLVTALVVSTLAGAARARAEEAERRRQEADARRGRARGARAGARPNAGGGGRGRGAAPQRRAEDSAAALGLPRPAHAADLDDRRRRGARLSRRSPRRSAAS